MLQNEENLGPRLKSLCNALAQAANRSAEEAGLTGAQAFMMDYIARHQPLYARDLERHFRLRHPTVSGIVQRLEGKGFLVCAPEETDRRCKRLWLTEQGQQANSLAVQRLKQVEQALANGFTAQEQREFSRLLDKAIESLAGYSQAAGEEKEELPL